MDIRPTVACVPKAHLVGMAIVNSLDELPAWGGKANDVQHETAQDAPEDGASKPGHPYLVASNDDARVGDSAHGGGGGRWHGDGQWRWQWEVRLAMEFALKWPESFEKFVTVTVILTSQQPTASLISVHICGQYYY